MLDPRPLHGGNSGEVQDRCDIEPCRLLECNLKFPAPDLRCKRCNNGYRSLAAGFGSITKHGRTLATMPRSPRTTSPIFREIFIDDFRGRSQVVPHLLHGLIRLRHGWKGRKAVYDQIPDQIRQSLLAPDCLSFEGGIFLLRESNRITYRSHA